MLVIYIFVAWLLAFIDYQLLIHAYALENI